MEKFYESLKEHRLSQNISLEDISNKTKISIRFLSAIEEGNFDILPYTYTRLFLKAYAKEINADADQALDALEKIMRSKATAEGKNLRSPEEFETQPSKQRVFGGDETILKKPRLKPLHGIILIAVLVFIIIIFQGLIQEKKTKEYQPSVSTVDTVRETTPTPVPTETEQTSQEPVIENTATDSSLTQFQPEPIQLQLITTDSVWIRIIIDDNEPREYLFAPNRDVSWTAEDHFQIRIGRPSAVKLKLNGQSLPFSAFNGAIPEFTVTRDGIIQ